MDKFTEQEVKHRAGWSKSNRRMFELYGNFTDQEINKSIYAHYGLTAEDKSTKLERCPRCPTVLVQGARMCHQCALVLDAGLEKELKVGQDQAQKALLKMMESPEVRALLKEMMNK